MSSFPAVFIASALGLTAAPSGPAQSSGDAAVLAGYQRWHEGDTAGAQRDFDQLVARSPESLPARFGALFMLHRRVGTDPAVAKGFEQELDAFIRRADARRDRSDRDTEALFYLAQAYLLRAQYRFEHGKGMLGAARDAARSRSYGLEYLRLHPEHGDAYLAIGLYNYYVDIAPAFVKFLRIFLFLPGGNRAEGLRQIERAAAEGSLFAFDARVVLTELYTDFEGRAADALRLAERLQHDFPRNPRVWFAAGEVYASPAVEQYARAAEAYAGVLDRCAAGAPGHDADACARAALGLASARVNEWRLDAAVTVLDEALRRAPSDPRWIRPRLLLARGNFRALALDPRASEDARLVLNDQALANWHDGARDQLKWIDGRVRSGEASVYAALVAGNRAVVERRWDDARRAYAAVERAHPGDAQVRYRLAWLQFSQADVEGASRAFTALAAHSSAPTWIRARSLLHVARAHDLQGRREQALKVYRRVIDEYEKDAAAGAARVGLISPYGRFELFKTTTVHDGAVGRRQHGFPSEEELPV